MKKIKILNILEVDNDLKEKVRQWRNKKTVRKFMLHQRIIKKQEHACWLENLKKKKDKKFWIVFYNNIPIGSVYLDNINYQKKTAELGIYIAEVKYRGKGLGKTVLYSFLNFCFNKLGIQLLWAKALSDNVVAHKLYQGLGFEKVQTKSIENNRSVLLFKLSKKRWLPDRKT